MEQLYWIYRAGRWSLHGPGDFLDVVARWAHAGSAVLVLPGSLAAAAGRRPVAELVPVFRRTRRRNNELVSAYDDCPAELQVAIAEFWPASEWVNAADIARLESNWDAFALYDTTTEAAPCGTTIDIRDGVPIAAERSIGYFQINSCNFPQWEPWRLYNARHNAGTAHALWDAAGQRWTPWFFSARKLGIA